ncbi:hypothetical protein FRC06_008160 [Ceratobasidium sp. 370]|nr:hypothetical protein FRC06_008160 [Ceratobasidium sp. 370]
MESPAPRVEVFLPGPISLDTSTRTSRLELKPLDQKATHVEFEQVASSSPSDLINDTLELRIVDQEEDPSSDPAVLILSPPGSNISMDTLSDDSILPTPIDPKFPAHAAEPGIVANAEEPNRGSLPQDHITGTLGRILQLPSSVTLLADSWNPPSPFVYHDQSPIQGTTRPIAYRKPADPAQPPALYNLHHPGSSISLFADAWNPPPQFVYEYQAPPMDGTRPIVPRNRQRDFQVCPGDLAANELSATSTTRSARRHAMIFEPDKPIERLASTLRSSAPAPGIGGPPGL